MKKLVILLLILAPVCLFAQVNDEIRRALDNYDYETVIALIAPNTPDSALSASRIQALKAMNRYADAIADLNSLYSRDSTNVKTLIDLAECYKFLNNYRQAAEYYRRALDLRPDNGYFRLQLIRSLLTAENFEDAALACRGMLERDSTSALGYRLLGQAYEGMHDVISAFFNYNIAYRHDSLDNQIVARIAGLFNDNNQYAEAIDVTEKYRLTDTVSIDVNRQNAKAYCLSHDYKNAEKRYESLTRMGDCTFTTFYYLGVSNFANGALYDARDNLKRAYQMNPDDVNLLYSLARVCARTSSKDEAVEYMEKAFNLAVPTDSLMIHLYEGLADCYNNAGSWDKEIDALKKQFEYSGKTSLLYRIGLRYERKEDAKNAIAYYEKYMATVPEKEHYALDDKGNVATDIITRYQDAERRIKKIKTEDFFKGKKN